MDSNAEGTEAGERALAPADLRILRELRLDARMSMSTLAERVGISRSNLYSRLESLEARGIILGFHAQVDSRRIGMGATAVILLKVEPRGWAEFRRAVIDVPEIEYGCVTTGGWDVVLFVRSGSVRELHVLTAGVIASLPSVTEINTQLTMDELVRRPFVLPDELPDRSAAREQLGIGQPVRGGPDDDFRKLEAEPVRAPHDEGGPDGDPR